MHWILVFLISMAIVALLMPMFIRLMEKYKFLDEAGGRKIHEGYTAHMGGIVIFLGFVLAFGFSFFSIKYLVSGFEVSSFFILLAFITILGIRDDMNSLSPQTKLIFEVIVGLCLCGLGVRITGFGGFLGIHTLPVWISYLLTIFFFIVVSNAFNLIDGIDGQAGLQAVAVFGFVCLFLWWMLPSSIYDKLVGLQNPYLWLMITASILGAVAGFLFYNWQKARIFMGDTGSLFVGFLIGIIIIVCMNLNNKYPGRIFGCEMKSRLGVILTFFFLPLADTLRVFIQRIKKGKSPFFPDKTHIHHILLRVWGFNHAQCAVTTFAIQVFVSSLFLFLSLFFNDNILAILIFVVWLLYVFLLRFLAERKMKHNKVINS
ncbi:MAG: undecaprenyl/decaprenyl-phosphate alpha-N-acetylglucosaminyl 1-phosphate transferase [Bacteroidales bacterium]|jgi:UDP-N-acetylmuramyl pentapeptide phosphotransferase/UDP-N-acetylglucosamine-1-phosphate transferase|nr:undecaprenyl/decaprenyl-phosphate alpha-N-acetylglucosaminyl 1-phosphate transferase [Bacteroidales bacterium]